MGQWFDWVRLAGAAYLIWLGWKMFRAAGAAGAGAAPASAPRGGFFLQGALVALSNPKTLLFFGAFFPQFLDPSRDHVTQIAIMGATAMLFAAVSDSAYAVLSGRAGQLLSQKRVRLLSRVSGGVMIGGGLWLASARVELTLTRESSRPARSGSCCSRPCRMRRSSRSAPPRFPPA